MSRATKIFGLLVSLGLGALICWLWSATLSLWPEMDSLNAPAISAEHAHITKYDDHGKRLWEIHARIMQTGEHESTATDVTVRFFDSEETVALTVIAPQARLQNLTGDIELLGAIRAQGSEFSFTTENLYWDNHKKTLSTASPVRVERDEFTLTGQGLEYSAETGLATIVSGARLILRSHTGKE